MTFANRMQTEPAPADKAAILAMLETIAAAHRARDAAAVAGCYAPGAVIADLAPPLVRHGFDVDGAEIWFDGWDGPVELTRRDLVVDVDGDLAVCHGLQHTRARSKAGETGEAGETAAWWCRLTLVLVRTSKGWRIVHEHSSVPFHMDGSYRAAVDLEP